MVEDVYAGVMTAEGQRRISVSGSGEVEIEPTIGNVRLGVNVVRRTADDALDEAARLVAQLSDAIAGIGIDRDDITTGRFSIQAEYDRSSAGRSSHPVGFRASYTVHILVREIDRTGDVVGAAVNAGANTIESVWFVAENYDEARNRARELAFEDARQKADQLVQLAAARLGEVLRINDDSYSPRRGYSSKSGGAVYQLREMSAQSPNFNPDDLTVSVNLHIVWALE